MNKRFLSYTCSAIALFASGAFAEDVAATGDGAYALESVVVTAQKRVQNPIEVPIALTAYSDKFLEKIGIQEFDKLSLFVPGFQVQNQSPGNPGFVVRGITSDSIDATVESRVSVFQDGVSISRAAATYVELFDIERIEVAKGPQSTLFGRGSLIGGVNVLTNHAKLDGFDMAASVEAGDYTYGLIDGMVNVPLSDEVAVRLAGRYKRRDGYVKNLLNPRDFNSLETAALRGSLTWKPSEDFSTDLIVNFERDGSSGTPFKSNSVMPSNPDSGTILGDLSPNSGATFTTVPGLEDGKNLGLSRTLWSFSGLTEYKINSALTLNSITAYRRFDVEEVIDLDGSGLPIIGAAAQAAGDQFSHEFRLNYNTGGMISAFAGASYFYENSATRSPVQYDERIMLALLTGQLNRSAPPAVSYFGSAAYLGAYAPAYLRGLAAKYGYALDTATATAIAANLPSNYWYQFTTLGKTKSADVYADITVRPLEGLELTGGIRYSYDDKRSGYSSTARNRSIIGGFLAAMKQTGTTRTALLAALATPGAASLTTISPSLLPVFGFSTQPTSNNGDRYYQSFDDDGLTWRVSGRYALTGERSIYASYARGRRPREYTPTSPSAPYGAANFTQVAAEKVDSYEVGYKALEFGGTLRFDTSLYHYEYNNFRTTQRVGTQLIVVNAGKASATGVETAIDWMPAENIDLFVTYAYGHARFGGESIYKGNQFRLTPDHKLSLGTSIAQKLFGGTFTFLPTWTWQSAMFFDDNNDIPALQSSNIIPDTVQDEKQGDYGLVNLKLTYQPERSPLTFSIFATNVLDKKFIKDAGNSGDTFGLPTFIAGEPRFIGASISYKLQ